MVRVDRILWLALVVATSALVWSLSWGFSIAGAGAVALLSVTVGCRRGFVPVVSAAVVVFVVTGGVALAARGHLRDPGLGECQGLMSGVGESPDACFESASEQALMGAFPAALILLAGLPPGLLRFAWDYGSGTRRPEAGDAAQ